MHCNGLKKPMDCSDILKENPTKRSGVYTIHPFGENIGIQALCDMETDGGGWTMIQRRMDGTVNFYRPWRQYKTGFGEADGEHWLGLEFIHMLSSRRPHELLVEMEDFEGRNASARYSSFSVGSECDRYRLQVSGFTDGGAGNSLIVHNDMKFTSFDKDQDTSATENCAKEFLGAFWYKTCHTANPNGVYRWGEDETIHAVGVEWSSWKGRDYSLKAISMKIRPAQ
ncbi:microfibril-associated glycoprotein 4-like [Eucyclogobius newberryi]|uniref:microfibril-associated glycoprotein 4-like n=1 Tax=Eucyclogobius newberryi TaxID=166745 RepID=UPI003B5C86C7